ncbi:tetratricopeptide repeat protein [uncultured Shewanella sp.]|uniref:tetratricopeptide repeat protein n=1 Tax=uncultured Shewanella sp. TaxID=173975 RepID=UPI002631D06F|nr:tetratricopeptide repeat protein [uncultured Shewanella sp.]
MLAILALIGCSSQQGVEPPQVNELQPKLFDPWCDYAVAGQADVVSSECIDNANQGDVDAATNLAYLYAQGILVERDILRAMDFYRIAAEKGMPEAQYSLAELYRSGAAGVAQPKLARYWYQQLVQQTVETFRYQTEAQFMLGLMYMEGNGGEKDLVTAARLLKLSSDNGHSEAPYVLGNLYLEEYANPQRAVDWYQLSAERGFALAMRQLATIYLEGLLGKVDSVKAEQWLLQAATHGLVEAQVDLATLEYNGVNGEPDLIKIYVWLAAAQHQGNEIATQRLAFITGKLNGSQLKQAKAMSQRCIQSQFQHCQASTLVN